MGVSPLQRLVRCHQIEQYVTAVHQNRPDPTQVVQPEVVEVCLFKRNLQRFGHMEELLPRRVADSDATGCNPFADEGLGHDPDRIREINHPRLRRALGHSSAIVHKDGNRSQGEGKPSGADRFLPGEAVLERDLFVADPPADSPHANAGDDERAPFERFVQ